MRRDYRSAGLRLLLLLLLWPAAAPAQTPPDLRIFAPPELEAEPES